MAGLDPASLPMPRSRGRALVGLCAAIADGQVPLDRSAPRAEVRARLLELPGIGPWTADYILLRSLGDPDVFLPTDVGVRHGLTALGVDPAAAEQVSRAWRPWRSYALMHLWTAAATRREGDPMSSWTIVTSPVDDLLVRTDGSAITGIDFEPHRPVDGGAGRHATRVLVAARTQLEEYFAGDRHEFDLPLRPAGTPFQQRVWAALWTVPFGRTVTYGEIARRVGVDPRTTSRAVGTANGSNPIPVVIPCHRVIGANGTLTGFGGGLGRKQVLLTLEQDTLF